MYCVHKNKENRETRKSQMQYSQKMVKEYGQGRGMVRQRRNSSKVTEKKGNRVIQRSVKEQIAFKRREEFDQGIGYVSTAVSKSMAKSNK